MDWIISDEYKLTVGNVLGHMAASAMVSQHCKVEVQWNQLCFHTDLRWRSSLRAPVSTNRPHTRSRWLLPSRLSRLTHRQHAPHLFLVSVTSDVICQQIAFVFALILHLFRPIIKLFARNSDLFSCCCFIIRQQQTQASRTCTESPADAFFCY